MPDQITVTTSKNWFSRIISSIVGLFIGLALVLIAFPLLWWNEGRSVKTARGLQEGAAVVADVAADRVDAANEGKLVHLSGPAVVEGTVTDPEFGVSAEAIKLVRTVEMFQWHETKKSKSTRKLGGSEQTTSTYTYSTRWSSTIQDSSSFQDPSHQNPTSIPWESKTIASDHVTLGAFTLSRPVIDLIDKREDRPVTEADARYLPSAMDTKVSDGVYYQGDPATPRVGDVRIRYQVVRPLTISVVAVQRGSTFEAFQAKSGTSILFVEPGTVTAASMFESAVSHNKMLAWILRGAGLILMWIGFALVLRPLAVVGSIVPLVGRIVGAGTGLVSFVMAFGLSLLTMAMAWVAYRPLLALSLVALAGAVVWLAARRHKRASAKVVPPPIPTGV